MRSSPTKKGCFTTKLRLNGSVYTSDRRIAVSVFQPSEGMRLKRVRPVRGLTAFFAVVVLLHAIAAQPAAACEHRHASSAQARSDLMADHDSAGGSNCDGQQAPVKDDHNADCLRLCLSMTGCATAAFVSEQTLAGTAGRHAGLPPSIAQSYPTRSDAPDRPPPRA